MKSAGTPNEAGGVAKNAVVDDALDGGAVVVLVCRFACTPRHCVARKATSSRPTRNIAGMMGESRLGAFMDYGCVKYIKHL